jgi:hypothetical protein
VLRTHAAATVRPCLLFGGLQKSFIVLLATERLREPTSPDTSERTAHDPVALVSKEVSERAVVSIPGNRHVVAGDGLPGPRGARRLPSRRASLASFMVSMRRQRP